MEMRVNETYGGKNSPNKEEMPLFVRDDLKKAAKLILEDEK